MRQNFKYLTLSLILIFLFALVGCSSEKEADISSSGEKAASQEASQVENPPAAQEEQSPASQVQTKAPVASNNALDLNSIPAYSGEAYTIINNNLPSFSPEEITTEAFESYSDLDSLGRVGVAYACLGTETMPTEERGDISEIKPTGWHSSKYDFVDGDSLYNRCHLIGFQLSGENANKKNLMTGTRYLNVEGMLPFENEVADFIKTTGQHVMYRVTPVFSGDNLVADGVQIEGYSVEDEGYSVSFNVYCYNVQPGVNIDYATGDNSEAEQAVEENTVTEEAQASPAANYVLNTKSMKFHYPDCQSVAKMSEKNRQDFTGSREELINQGYSPCGQCNP